ncbi:JAB domain-containing protein [Sphingobacterium siyangense]
MNKNSIDRFTDKIMDIRVADHLIFTDNGYYSFKDEGIID